MLELAEAALVPRFIVARCLPWHPTTCDDQCLPFRTAPSNPEVNQLRETTIIATLLIIAASASAVPAADFSIAGIELGMNADQVVARYQELRPGGEYQFTKWNLPEGSEWVANGRALYNDLANPNDMEHERMEFAFTGLRSGNKLFAVRRTLKFRPSERPSAEAVYAAAVKKYGEPSQAWLFANNPDPLKRNTPPLKDWRATREHYYLQYKAYGQPMRPRGRIFVWHPDIASGSSSSMQDSFAPQLAAAEDAFRRENGIPEIGQGWVSEVSLFSLVRSLFPDAVHQWRPPFMGLQSVDIYVSSAKLAIEYQGKQHYEAVKLFGGEEGLLSSQARDGRKRELLKANGIDLIEWRYDQLISAGAVSAILARYLR